MNEKKKGFNLFPEYVWMIFVGMLLAIIILTNVIPGHAANMYPLSPDDMGYGANYVSHITVKGSELYVGGNYIANVGQILQESEDRIAKFESDADAALASFFAQIPKDQIYFGVADDSGYGSVLNWLRSFLDDRDIQYSEIIIDNDNPFWYPQLWPDDWRDDYSQSIYSLGPFSVNVYVRKTLLTPSATPTPAPEPSREYVIIKSSSYYYAIFFDYNSYVSTQPLVISGNQNVALTYAVNNYGVGYDFSFPTIIFQSGSSSYSDRLLSLYIPSAVSCNFTLYSLGESLPFFDYSEIPSHFDPYSMTSSSNIPSKNGSWYYSFNSSLGLNAIGCYKYSNGLSFIDSSLYTYVVGYESSFFTSDFFITGYNVADNLLTLAYKYGCSSDPTYNPNITPSPGPTATPEPLPTSGESIHVILPSGTPTPTPPFSVPGGSDGGTGSGSPGSIGSGLSSQQTSGILEYWSSFVSDNPAMLFLTSTFQSLPSELLYPLYILLFILLLLAVIRLFVHFSGG